MSAEAPREDGLLAWIDRATARDLLLVVLLLPLGIGLVVSILLSGLAWADSRFRSQPSFLVARAATAGGGVPLFRADRLNTDAAPQPAPVAEPIAECTVTTIGTMVRLSACATDAAGQTVLADGIWPVAGTAFPAAGTTLEDRALAAMKALVGETPNNRLQCAAMATGVTCRKDGVWLDAALLQAGLVFPTGDTRSRSLAAPAVSAGRGVWWDGLALETPPAAAVAWRQYADAATGMAESTSQSAVTMRTAFMATTLSGTLTGLGVLLGLRQTRSDAQRKLDAERALTAKAHEKLKKLLGELPGAMFSNIEQTENLYLSGGFETQRAAAVDAIELHLRDHGSVTTTAAEAALRALVGGLRVLSNYDDQTWKQLVYRQEALKKIIALRDNALSELVASETGARP